MNKTKIKMLVMDVDGTLTDGKIYYSAQGEMFKAFNVRDGYRLINAEKLGLITVIITGKTSEIVARRAADLKINEVYQGIHDKLGILREVAKKYDVSAEEIAYIGDDENDLECIEFAGISACPSDAEAIVIKKSDYVCRRVGGDGAVREFIDYFLAI